MKISRVFCWKEDLALAKPYTIAYRTIEAVENVFVFLELESGHYGVGAGSPAPMVTGERIDDAMTALEKSAEELLLGNDIRQYQGLLRRAELLLAGRPAALAAIDIALHDAFSRWLDLPLVDFLGKVHDSFPTSVTIGILPLEETLAEGEAFVREGFQVIKLKTGRSVEEDIETFRMLREKVGPHIRIRVDANQGYTATELQRFAAATERYDVEFFEQPLPPRRLEVMRGLSAELRRRCAADEDLHSPQDALLMTQVPQPYGIYNIKLMKCGGIEAARRIAESARLAGIDLMWGCNDESAVSIAAALHIALASPATRYLDLDGSLDLARDVVTGGFALRNGYMSSLDKPGLGVELLTKP